MKIFAVFLCFTTIILAAPTLAQTTVFPDRAGYVTAGGGSGHTSGTGSIFTGDSVGQEWRGYLRYTVPQSTTPYTSALIRLNVSGVANGPNNITIYEVTTRPGIDSNAAVFADQGNGTVFGSTTVGSSNATVDFVLNADGVSAVNAARGSTITFGFTKTAPLTAGQYVFGASTSSTPRSLVLMPTASVGPIAVPTLGDWAMILFGLALLSGAALHIQRRTARLQNL